MCHTPWKAPNPFWAATYQRNSNNYFWAEIPHTFADTCCPQPYDIIVTQFYHYNLKRHTKFLFTHTLYKNFVVIRQRAWLFKTISLLCTLTQISQFKKLCNVLDVIYVTDYSRFGFTDSMHTSNQRNVYKESGPIWWQNPASYSRWRFSTSNHYHGYLGGRMHMYYL